MGTWIVLHNKQTKEYAVFDYKPGTATTSFYGGIRDRKTVSNTFENPRHVKYNALGTCITVSEWIAKYSIPKCLERIYDPHGWIPL